METLQSLRSLDVRGGSPGTGRSTSSAPRERDGGASFDEELQAARTSERRSEASVERRDRRGGRSTERAAHAEQRREVPAEPEMGDAPGRSETNPDVAASDSEASQDGSRSQPPQASRRTGAPSKPALAPQSEQGIPGAGGSQASRGEAQSVLAGTITLQTSAQAVAAITAAPAPLPAVEAARPNASKAASLVATEAQAVAASAVEPAATDAPAPSEPAKSENSTPTSSESRAAFEPALAKTAREGQAPAALEAARADPSRAHAADQAADLLRQVRVQLAPELRQATIQLEPAALGRLDIRIEVRRGRVRAELSVERRETLETLERHAPELRAALGAAGFEDAELALSLADRPSREHARAPQRAPHAPAEAAATRTDVRAALASRLALAGGVDTYA
jgi:flagellar hook-length control protein FliK